MLELAADEANALTDGGTEAEAQRVGRTSPPWPSVRRGAGEHRRRDVAGC
jgi:hypothetical protein